MTVADWDWVGSSGLEGGTTTVIGVGGMVTWTVVGGMVTVAVMAWPWSPTPVTSMVCGGVVTMVVSRSVTALSVMACLRTCGMATVSAGVVTVTGMGMDGTVTVAGSPMVTVIGWLMTVAESVTGGTVTARELGVTWTEVCTVPVVPVPKRARAAPTEIGAGVWVGVDTGGDDAEPPVGPCDGVEAAPCAEDEATIGSRLGTPDTAEGGGVADPCGVPDDDEVADGEPSGVPDDDGVGDVWEPSPEELPAASCPWTAGVEGLGLAAAAEAWGCGVRGGGVVSRGVGRDSPGLAAFGRALAGPARIREPG
ncbi:MAG: hypothetical protein J2P57_04195 [Acidimicrobiaceae bacterium]|nr:hypothetical protein [Acidimicrobiaceae bacterium]